jgi:hypothetical protein
MTDREYERLDAVPEGDGMTLGEWVREVLLERAEGRKPSVIEETLLAETLALHTILMNAFYKLAQGEKLTAERMQAIIERADAGKVDKAAERLEAASTGKAQVRCEKLSYFFLVRGSLVSKGWAMKQREAWRESRMSGLRGDDIRRLRVGCIRWRTGQSVAKDGFDALQKDALCFL